jgi:3-hydroxymyristoyl/3-hydroxydecanoyl-(acyl carrier protein) dehydratase/malonyl CoA-acyl carrier protein transacylase
VAVPWISGAIDRPAETVREVISEIGPDARVYLLIVNTPTQCVIGGDRQSVDTVVRSLNATFVPFPAASTVHCPVLREVESAYRELHLMETQVPQVPAKQNSPARQIDFYSTAWGHAYSVNRQSAAEAIVAQAVGTIDFPQVVRQAYADGVRLFVEIGSGSSCTRMIEEILEGQPFFAQSATPVTAAPVIAFLELLAGLIAHRVPVDLKALYGSSDRNGRSSSIENRREIVTKIGRPPFEIPSPTNGWPVRSFSPDLRFNESTDDESTCEDTTSDTANDEFVLPADMKERAVAESSDVVSIDSTVEIQAGNFIATSFYPSEANGGRFQHPRPDGYRTNRDSVERTIMTQLDDMLAARLKAHEKYLQLSAESQRVMSEQLLALAELSRTVTNMANRASHVSVAIAAPANKREYFASDQSFADPAYAASGDNSVNSPHDTIAFNPQVEMRKEPPRSLSRVECMEFAIGKIGRVLGEKFAEIDSHPTRVRLPDEPLMLVDRILHIDGEPLSMTTGRVVTEHDIHPGAWYLDCNRIPTCIAVEAGQADLFLSGWLGIDVQTKGLACYRLLDAVITFHRELPQPGQMIHYDIRINGFFRQGQTYLFRFEFDATVDGQPLLTMREGCAGFFTEAELAGGKGIVHTKLDLMPRTGKRSAEWRDLVPMAEENYDDAKLLALRHGRLDECFGPAFSRLAIKLPVTIPGLDRSTLTRTRMWLVDRILKLDPKGGKFGLGMILGELDIHPDDWFLTCHFCDDQVMPGTLMYECCMHTLRIYLLRMGWIGEAGQVAYEPIPGIRSRLKCRGQVRADTKKVWYEVTIKEIGYATDDHFGTNKHSSESRSEQALQRASDSPTLSPTSSRTKKPYCIADALMYADGKPIVEMTDMSVWLSGLDQQAVEALWDHAVGMNRQTAIGKAETIRQAAAFQYD